MFDFLNYEKEPLLLKVIVWAQRRKIKIESLTKHQIEEALTYKL